MAAGPVIEARGLTKRYPNGVLALDNLHLKVFGGEIYCLLGPNGAGKTTTIGLFFDFHRPTAGQALICGVEVAEEPMEAKRHAAYMAENVLLYGRLTALQNLDFFARLAGRRDWRREDSEALLHRVGLQAEAFRREVRTFSKGMRQKLGIAVAMAKGADALLLDEPTTGLDPKAADDFVAILRGLQQEGKALLVCTHDLLRVAELATRVGIMRAGRLVREHTSADFPGGVRDLFECYEEAMADGDGREPVQSLGGGEARA
ncbi:MAG: ABC transporter ATP-binding protein [Acidobacteriota bacterium]